ncbi:MAG: hypothetical protein N2319_03980 [Candidatus Kapabacteria bacterium]|nr:hypothetical protein [Candidatus Kapabacteria bacterium]
MMKLINKVKSTIRNNTFKDIIRKLVRYFINIELHYRLYLDNETYKKFIDKYPNYAIKELDIYSLKKMKELYPLEISEKTYNNLLKTLNENSISKCFVIFCDNEIAGYMNIALGYDFDSINNQYVEKEKNIYFFALYTFIKFRASGAQTFAKAQLLNLYHKNGFKTSSAFIQKGNWRSKKFFDKFGGHWYKKVIKINFFGIKFNKEKLFNND